MAKKKDKPSQSIPIVGSIGDEVPSILHPLVEYIVNDSKKAPEEFEIYSYTPDSENAGNVKVYVYFDKRTWAKRYSVPKALTENYIPTIGK